LSPHIEQLAKYFGLAFILWGMVNLICTLFIDCFLIRDINMQVKNPKCFIEFHIELEFELKLNSSANIPILGKGKVGIFDDLLFN
jgi:hypothetical protein